MKGWRICVAGLFAVIAVTACSKGGEEKAQDEHVWKGQTDALDRAKATEQVLKDAADRRAEQSE